MKAEQSFHGGIELAEAVRSAYCQGQTDYSLEPLILTDRDGNPIGRIGDGDAVIFCCRRGEREVQLTEAFVDFERDYFPRAAFSHLPFVILTLYHEKFKNLPVAFAPRKISNTLAELLSRVKLRQAHISESEKFAHVTFFFNGGNNQPFNEEIDVRIPSPHGIPLDQQPELSLPQVTDAVCQAVADGIEFILVNFANGDVIGHTANRESKIKCAEVVDSHLGRVVSEALSAGYIILVTADHGNLEELFNPDGSPNVSHTSNPVPFVIVTSEANKHLKLHPGSLADIAPTILSLYGIDQPESMTGVSLIASSHPFRTNKILLIILDGWGVGKSDPGNPIHLADTPHWDDLLTRYPTVHLQAAGEFVGLKAGKNGNSEAGHMNIGAGRVVLQDDVRLDMAMQDGSFYSNEIFISTLQDVKLHNSRLHLIALLSEKSSHGSLDYPLALLRMAKQHGLTDVYIHVIFDGRSTEPGSAPQLLEKFEAQMADIGLGMIVTGIGRGIALDRDGNYWKTRCAYDAMVFGTGKKYSIQAE